jgi:hypothetical protein
VIAGRVCLSQSQRKMSRNHCPCSRATLQQCVRQAILSNQQPYVLFVVHAYAQSMFMKIKLPCNESILDVSVMLPLAKRRVRLTASISDLHTGLTNVNRDNFAHVLRRILEVKRRKSCLSKIQTLPDPFKSENLQQTCLAIAFRGNQMIDSSLFM